MRHDRTVCLTYTGTVLLVVPVWEWASRSSSGVRLLLSSPISIAGFINANAQDLLRATWVTWLEAFLGLLLAVGTSLTLMVLTFFVPRLMRFVMPAMIASQVIPLIVLAPFFVLALGIGVSSKVAMAAVLCFFPMFVGMAQGYRLIPQNVHDLLSVYEARTATRVLRAYLPLAMPSGMAGLKVSATLSVIGAIVAEFTGSEVGLGRNLFLSTIRLQPDLMMASLAGSAILGATMFWGVHLIEQRFGAWYLPASGE
ncbi:MAG: ABC transporter permease subunit [Vicinamibacterales bacterium]